MNQEELKKFCLEVALTMQGAMFYTKTGQTEKSQTFRPKYDSLEKMAAENGIEIVILEKNSVVNIPIPELKNYKTKTSELDYIGAWTIPEGTGLEHHIHITLEFVVDGTSGHAEIRPGDIEIDYAEDGDGEDILDRKSEEGEPNDARSFDRDFLRGRIQNPFDDQRGNE